MSSGCPLGTEFSARMVPYPPFTLLLPFYDEVF
jgi:hypothetical protein